MPSREISRSRVTVREAPNCMLTLQTARDHTGGGSVFGQAAVYTVDKALYSPVMHEILVLSLLSG